MTRKSLITRALSAIAHARSAKTRPRSRPPPGDGSAADRPARPVGELPQQHQARVRHDARADARDFKTARPS
jgi:hypothetical protein